MIDVILTGFRRPDNFLRQLEAVYAQATGVAEVFLYRNGDHGRRRKEWLAAMTEAKHPFVAVMSTRNLGVWSRFSLALECTSDYVCVLDDDTIPGPRCFEHYLNTMQTHEGFLGGNGVIFTQGTRAPRQYVGWATQNVHTAQTDIAGHLWFFKREWIHDYLGTPRQTRHITCGEDIHWSFVMQKLGLGVYIPPHPPGQTEFWSSTEGKLGTDAVALYRQKGEEEKKAETHEAYRAAGWKTLFDREQMLNGPIHVAEAACEYC